MRNSFGIPALFLFALAISLLACKPEPVPEPDPSDLIVQAEKDALIFMREEEKLARDVYLEMNDTWSMTVFEHISASEQTHMDAVLNLLEIYGLEDPVGDNERGVFGNQILQNLYDDLTEQGRQSVIDALKAGAAIEEIDILDLENYYQEIDRADIITVFENLQKGSRNHLRAFVKNLDIQGVSYEPQYLDQATFDSIINSPKE